MSTMPPAWALKELRDQWKWRPSLAVLIVGAVAAAVAYFAAALAIQNRALRVENAKLREAFAVMRERQKWSCEIEEGERIICGVKDGMLARLNLDESDHVVSGKSIASPLGKSSAKKKRRSK